MKKLKIMAAALFTAFMAASCGSGKSSLQPEALNGEWNIITVNGQQPKSEKQAYIGMNLQEQRLYGCAGCNRIMGSVKVDDGKAGLVTFGQVASTRMLCQDMTTETAVLEALNKVAAYNGTEKELNLSDGKGNILFTLSKRPEATIASLNGRWTITAVYGETVADIEQTEETPFVEFDAKEKRVHGNAGCNLVNGGFTQTDGNPTSLKFAQLITTMKAGPGMTVEGKVLEGLNNTRYFVVKDETHAALMDENGEEALSLEKQN